MLVCGRSDEFYAYFLCWRITTMALVWPFGEKSGTCRRKSFFWLIRGKNVYRAHCAFCVNLPNNRNILSNKFKTKFEWCYRLDHCERSIGFSDIILCYVFITKVASIELGVELIEASLHAGLSFPNDLHFDIVTSY